MAFFQFVRFFEIPENTEGQSVQLGISPDKELIIELISGNALIPTGQFMNGTLQIIPPANADGSSRENGLYTIIANKAGAFTDALDFFPFSQQLHVFADPGTTVNIIINRFHGATGIGIVNLTMTGQILDAGTSGPSVDL
jgi:hypothetical protein